MQHSLGGAALDSKQKKTLKAKAHGLKPVVRIGQKGIAESVIRETDLCLEKHELIKVQVQQGERQERAALMARLAESTGAEIIHQIGKVFVLYRKRRQKQ